MEEKLFTVYFYIMFNFEHYTYITYSERETKGGRGRGRKKRIQNKKKKRPTNSMSPSCFQRHLLHFLSDNKMVIALPPQKRIKVVFQKLYDTSCLNPSIFPSPSYFLFYVLPDGLNTNTSRKSSLIGSF